VCQNVFKICMLFILLNNSGQLHWDESLPSTNVLQVDKYFFLNIQYIFSTIHNTTLVKFHKSQLVCLSIPYFNLQEFHFLFLNFHLVASYSHFHYISTHRKNIDWTIFLKHSNKPTL
jgi:hypothetical protein